jgi:hypothetical protein
MSLARKQKNEKNYIKVPKIIIIFRGNFYKVANFYQKYGCILDYSKIIGHT